MKTPAINAPDGGEHGYGMKSRSVVIYGQGATKRTTQSSRLRPFPKA
jgi:hypothetical protein